jgi:hypothetical protein
MKIQISPVKRVDDALVIWYEKTPDTDIVMDPRIGLNIREASIKVIYAFNILGAAEPNQILPILQNLFNLLESGGEIYIVDMDFDYINRSYIGGDLTLAELNQDFRRKTYLSQQEIVRMLSKVGFPEKDQRQWFDNLQFKKAHYEMIVSGKKPKIQ